MKLFRNWILQKAEKIKAEEKALADAEESSRRKKDLEARDHRKVLRNIIEANIDKIIEEENEKPCHISPGDKAIMNYFSIGRDGRNSWDGGVSSLLNNIPKEERTAPVIVTVTEIFVDTSLAYDRVDKFFEQHSYEYTNAIPVGPAVWSEYKFWLLQKHGGPFPWNIGLYKTALFKYEGSFQPRWGLNVDSFLKEGTPEYEKTYELWSLEIEIIQKRTTFDTEMKILESQMRKIDEEYRNIKYKNE